MIVVIQCAASKRLGAGHLRTQDGRPVSFVARPQLAPPADGLHHAHPDEPSLDDGTWRDVLLRYNRSPGSNPLGLLRAASLYAHPVYARLEARVGPRSLFILSAGWGLLPASFLTPDYDITFSAQAEPFVRRRRADRYRDFRFLPEASDAPMMFFGGKDYVGLFLRLTDGHRGLRTIWYNASDPPLAPGCDVRRHVTARRTNWHYECAEAWLGDGA
jgi:hypothetical protein